MTTKVPINLDYLLHYRIIESERVECKADWGPEASLAGNEADVEVVPIPTRVVL